MIGGLYVLFPILESQVLDENEHLGLLSLDHTHTELSLDLEDVSSLRSYSLGMYKCKQSSSFNYLSYKILIIIS